MLSLFVNVLIVAALVLVVAYSLKKYLTLSKTDSLLQALDEQRESKARAELAAQINPEEINNNNAKVKETLDKLN